MQSEKPGIQAAIDEIGGPAAPPREDAEQLPLLGDQAPAESTGPGRPPVSRNKRTAEWTEYLLGRHASPLEGLAEISSMSIEDCKILARELGCTALQFWERQQWAWKELAPYLHQKQPMAIDAGKDGLVVLNLAVSAKRGE